MNNWKDWLPSPYIIGLFIGGIIGDLHLPRLFTTDMIQIFMIVLFGSIANKVEKLRTGSQPAEKK
jgi:tRNA 2-selenouridine synthase SelU